MSGICGIVRLDGSNAEPRSLHIMLKVLETRGPDRTGSWHDGSISLGHTLLGTTREALSEEMPLVDRASGCVIIADARLDSRSELMASLNWKGSNRSPGDGELILAAYHKWGTDCAEHLLGDFAFAIWDANKRRLLCARDHLGMRQICYHFVPGRLFAFATEPEAIAGLEECTTGISNSRVADFIDNMEASDLSSTFFTDIYRLPPAHSLIVGEGGLSIRRYWRPEPKGELQLKTDADYSRAFLDVLGEAIRCRLRSAGPVGTLMSGGLDSGAIASVASQMLKEAGRPPLKAFSIAGELAHGHPETFGIYSLCGLDHIDPHIQSISEMSEIATELLRKTLESREPFDGHMILVRAAYLAAARANVNVVLDGVGADVLFTPDYLIAHLIEQGKLAEAIAETAGERNFWAGGTPPSGTLLAEGMRAWLPRPIRELRRRLLHQRRSRHSNEFDYMSQGLRENVDLQVRRMECYQHRELAVFPDPGARQKIVTHPDLIVGRERYDRVASAFAIEPRDPFTDIRLIDFCLSLPRDLLQKGGWPKILMRRALQGRVPASIRWKKGRHHLGWPITAGLMADIVTPEIWSGPIAGFAAKFMDVAMLRRSAGDWQSTIAGQLALFDAYYLLNWLNDNRRFEP